MLHRFTTSITDIPLPERFTYPFCYTPHPLCILAAKEVQSYLTRQTAWKDELRQGKMFGVLIVQTEHGETGYLAAFSGILAGKNLHPFFVPPVYDLLQPQGFFKIEEENISSINRNIRQLENDKAYAALSAELARTIQSAEDILATAKAQLKEAKTAREQRRKEKELNAQEEAELIRESQFQKAEYKRLERSWKARITTLQTQTEDWERRISALKSERKTRSAALQQKLFEQFGMLNYRGEVKNLCEIFGQTVHKTPPAGAGECAAPKLLQQAYLHGWKPIAMADILPLDFTMARNEAVREDSYRAAAAAIKAELSVGRDVAMVNLGDVSVYATAYYILERIRDDGFETVMCPGVTSFCAVAARLGRSLTRMDEPLHILSGSTDLNNALALPGTKVVMKSGKAIHETAEALKRHGLLANAGMVADCGLETEQVYTDLRQLPEEISYFATIVAD